MDEHGIVSFSSPDRDKFDACFPDLELGTGRDGDIRLEAAHVIQVEAVTDRWFVESRRRIDYSGKLILEIAPGIETWARIQTTEIGVASHMVPMSVGDEDGGQWRQARILCSQCLIRNLRGVRPRAGIDADQFSPILRYDEIVFGELETRQNVHASWHNRGDATRSKGMPCGGVLGERRDQRDGPVPILVASPLKVLLRLRAISPRKRELSEVIVDFPQPACMGCTGGIIQAPK